ncbi:hypothetical protein MKA31_20255 [[Clostridium] innocuum]|uniref:hypothetical protein n=1 Tax=Clostridium innocuum TaxID=1522 RepID=UPI002148FECB|nr:hypothetical protein [[Clostridium] innocuum]MCR0274430.1 hypothetical protein [[Clostridium] innocuum]
MKIKFLSSKEYENKAKNCGDCIIITSGAKMVVYDCGCEEHAKCVINEMSKANVDKVIGVLSHNDKDHFDGFLTLINNEKIECIYTICALKHVDDILLEINDDRYKRDSVKNKIIEIFGNIHELSGYLKDIYEDDNSLLSPDIVKGVKVLSPNYHYAIETIARAVKNSEPNTIDGDSVMNAASVCLKIYDDNNNMLLTGDSTFENIEAHLSNLNYIQLPHHGRADQLDEILNYYDENEEDPMYLISDNTGESNGGVDARKIKYRRYKNTRDKEFEIDFDTTNKSSRPDGSLGVEINEMLY